jgi:hypothetical protein
MGTRLAADTLLVDMVLRYIESLSERTQMPQCLNDNIQEAIVLACQVDQAFGIGQVHRLHVVAVVNDRDPTINSVAASVSGVGSVGRSAIQRVGCSEQLQPQPQPQQR